MATKEKVEVGQVWECKDPIESVTITRIDENNMSYCKENSGAEDLFGRLNAYGHGLWDDTTSWGWQLKKTVIHPAIPIPKQAETKERPNELYMMFARVHPGNCACNIPREQCDYHR